MSHDKKKIGYPFQYGHELTPEMTRNNRKQAVSYSVLIPSIWWHNLGFGEPIQYYSSCLNESKTPIVQIGKDQAAQKDVNTLIKQLSLGNDNPGIGNRRVKGLKNVSEARGRNEGRVYFREKDVKIEILAKSNKDNQNKVISILQKIGY